MSSDWEAVIDTPAPPSPEHNQQLQQPMPRSERSAPLPSVWTTLAFTVGTLWVNWVWGRLASNSSGQELFLLMLFSIFLWPLAVALVGAVFVGVFKHTPGLIRAILTMGAIALGLARFGVPTLWNIAFTAAVATTVLIRSKGEKEENAAREKL